MKKINRIIIAHIFVATSLMSFSTGFAQNEVPVPVNVLAKGFVTIVVDPQLDDDIKKIVPKKNGQYDYSDQLKKKLSTAGYMIADKDKLAELRLVMHALGQDDKKIPVHVLSVDAAHPVPLIKVTALWNSWGFKKVKGDLVDYADDNTYEKKIDPKAVEALVDLYRNQNIPGVEDAWVIKIQTSENKYYSLGDMSMVVTTGLSGQEKKVFKLWVALRDK